VLADVQTFSDVREDDMTLLVIDHRGALAGTGTRPEMAAALSSRTR
jgi:hypothetical protein